jgi:hypothetical protein
MGNYRTWLLAVGTRPPVTKSLLSNLYGTCRISTVIRRGTRAQDNNLRRSQEGGTKLHAEEIYHPQRDTHHPSPTLTSATAGEISPGDRIDVRHIYAGFETYDATWFTSARNS